MKNFITKFAAWIVLAVMFVMLIPGISLRISSEAKNNNITVSFLYNNIVSKTPKAKLNKIINDLKSAGVTTVSILEEDLNYLVKKGEITSMKYNELCNKYDEQSLALLNTIKEGCPDISQDSYIILINDAEKKEFFKYYLPRKFSTEDYASIGELDGFDIYVFHDGRKNLWDFSLGYNEKDIESLIENGFNVTLVHKVKNYSNVAYLNDIERIIKKYGINFISLKTDSYEVPKDKENPVNYKKLSKIITNNDMTLVVTENPDHLSNQKFFGYSYVLDNVLKSGGPQKILRSYETYDDSQAAYDNTKYKYRTEQFFNSTIDRNIRFITVTLMEPAGISYTECAENTVKSAKEYIEKIEKNGYTHSTDINKIDYHPHKTLNSAVGAVIMIMFVLLAYQMISGNKNFKLTIAALILSVIAFVATFFMPEALLSLYPTAYSVIHSCFAMTVLLYFLKVSKDKFSTSVLTLLALALMLGTLLICAVVQGTLLSGISYYINNDIFRGIKLSLIVPIVYTTVIFYLMYLKKAGSGFLSDVKKVLTSQIKVHWMIIGGVFAAIVFYYIMRSGNVSSISSAEKLMRTALTEIFPARPRTKEFLIGYPAVVLLVYYIKNTNINIMKWMLAIAASILAASISNSFCHVFTNFQTIVMRTFNGLLVGILVSVVAIGAHALILKLINVISKKFENMGMK